MAKGDAQRDSDGVAVADVAYIWGHDVVGVETSAAAHLTGVDVRRIDLRDGIETLSHATRSGALFGPIGVCAAGAGALRAADAKTLGPACAEGVRVVLIADRAAPTWLQRSLQGRLTLIDRTVPKGNGFSGWVRATGTEMGLRIKRDAADVIAAAVSGEPGRARSVLWVCRATGLTKPTAAQISRVVEGWSSDTHAFSALDFALTGDRGRALSALDGVAAPVVAAALRTSAKRAAELEAGDVESVPRFARSALTAAQRRGVGAAELAAHTVAVEFASRGHADDTGVVAVAVAEIADLRMPPDRADTDRS